MSCYTYENNMKGPFNLDKGSTHNAKCPDCDTSTWYCEYPYQTMYEGMNFLDNNQKVVGILDLKGNVYCNDCYTKRHGVIL